MNDTDLHQIVTRPGIPKRERDLLSVLDYPLFVPLCLVVAVLLRVLWVVLVETVPLHDAGYYYDHAIEIAFGHGYVSDGVPTAYMPVGYPAFLALILTVMGHSLLGAKLANVMLSTGSLWLSYRLARSLTGSERTSRLTLLLLSIHPNGIAYCALLVTEPLFVFLTLLGSLLLLSPRKRSTAGLFGGVVWGLATLVRPQAVLLPIVVELVRLRASWSRRRGSWHEGATRIIWVYLVLMLTIAPWLWRNYRSVGSGFFVSTNGGVNLLLGNNPFATGGFGQRIPVETVIRSDLPEYERDRVFAARAWAYIRANPGATIRRLPHKLDALFMWDYEGMKLNQTGQPVNRQILPEAWVSLKILAQGYYVLLLGCFFSSVALMPWATRVAAVPPGSTLPWPTLSCWIVGVWVALHCVVFGDPRFHFPLIPWMAIDVATLLTFLSGRLADSGRLRNTT
jgi:hypothetical protein